MNSKNEISNALALFSTGLLAGTFMYVKFNIIPTFWELSQNNHLLFRFTLMKYNDVYFQSLLIFTIFFTVWFTWRLRFYKHIFIFTIFSVFLSILTYLITYFGNMQINEQIKIWLQTAPPENSIEVLKTWDFYHTCRTFSALVSFIMILMATFFKKQLLKKQMLK